MIHGFLAIDKPAGITSHDVVARVRRLARQKRVGHAGTLDPAATGVLVVALGQATRLVEYVQDETHKRYHAWVQLGQTTATDDAEGEVLTDSPVPAFDEMAITQALQPFNGTIMQVPPMYSALHHQGQRLYELARAGQTIDLPARPVQIYAIRLLELALPTVVLDVECGKGTYIRSLARDLGAALGCGAHLSGLRRTAVGSFTIERATTLDDLVNETVALGDVVLPPFHAVRDWPAVPLDAEQAALVRNGRSLELAQPGERAVALAPDGALLALLAREDELWRPTKVFDWTN